MRKGWYIATVSRRYLRDYLVTVRELEGSPGMSKGSRLCGLVTFLSADVSIERSAVCRVHGNRLAWFLW